ncbi:MAG: hypothetical protein ABFD50_19775 [Smithella sp.]
MEAIAISASPKQLSKLRNGHRVRVSGAMQGQGINLLVDPAKFNQMSRSFDKGSASQIQLSPAEIQANRQAVADGAIGGEGIFAGGKAGSKRLARMIRNAAPTLKKTGATLGKPFEKTVQVNPFTLGYDLGHDVIAPELKRAPGIRQHYKGGKIKMPSMKKIGKTLQNAEKAIRKNPVSRAIVKKVLPVAAKLAVTAAAQRAGLDPAATKELSGLTQQGTTAGLTEAGYGLYAGAQRGRGLLEPRSRLPEQSSLMVGGSILGLSNPNLASDPYGANFHMSTQLPVELQRMRFA